MWGSAFYDDDARNGPLAHERGIVIGTSHHEPLLRAQQEWHRGAKRGAWDYTKNAEALREFWADGARRARDWETLVTVGMRGDGDEPMPGDASVALLERIVADQRRIIERETGRAPEQVPQVWALYKEVQGYYESGMRVPDDVTLLWSDDNWGYIRRLPTADERGRSGGAGVYYHLDYVGGPRSYKWLNVTPLPKIWEQMHLAWQHGATRLWMVNVGDLKPMEVPTEFFLRYAWNPAQWPAERLDEYLQRWATREFGPAHAGEIAQLVAGYTRFNSRRTPELLGPETYSRVNYREAERVVAEYNDLARRAQAVRDALPAAHRDAFVQLVLHPVQACAVLNDLHVATGLNHLYARQGRASTAAMATRVRELFARDAELTRRFHEDVAGGKWNHMMSQTHIGYTSWNQPRTNVMPTLHEGAPPRAAQLGVMAEGSEEASSNGVLTLPALDAAAREPRWIELFNRGTAPLRYRVRAEQPWLQVSEPEGDLSTDRRLHIAVDWRAAPADARRAVANVEGSDGSRVRVELPLREVVIAPTIAGFVESDGVVAIEAAHTTARISPAGRQWLEVPGHGRTFSGMTPMPVPAPALAADANGMRLEYAMHLSRGGVLQVHTTLAPTLNFQPGEGLRYAISIDDEVPQIVNVHADTSPATWARRVIEGAMVHRSEHRVPDGPGTHTLKFWVLDAGLVVQRLVVDAGGLRPSTLGPPESPRQR